MKDSNAKIGILINNAPYTAFFHSISKFFVDNNYNIVLLFDSKVSEYYHKFQDSHYPKFYLNSNDYKVSLNSDSFELNNHSIGELFFSDIERIKIVEKGSAVRDHNYVEIFNKYYFNTLFAIKKYDLKMVLYESVSNSLSRIVYQAVHDSGILFYGLTPSRMPGRFEICKDPYFDLKSKKETFTDSDTKEYISNITNIVPDYMNINLKATNKSIYSNFLDLLINAKQLLSAYISSEKKFNYGYFKLFPFFRFALFSRFRRFMIFISLRFHTKIFDFNDISELEDHILQNKKISFFLYPIHFHPEASTSVLAKFFTNELSNIENISLSLPLGCTLLVKEHTSNIGRNDLGFYKHLKNNPSVKLVAPKVNSKKLISLCNAIITITSTMGFESLILNKPVFCFGKVFYNKLPGCIYINSFESLESSLQRFVKNPASDIYKPDPYYTVKYYSSITRPGNLNLLEECTLSVFNSIIKELAFDLKK